MAMTAAERKRAQREREARGETAATRGRPATSTNPRSIAARKRRNGEPLTEADRQAERDYQNARRT